MAIVLEIYLVAVANVTLKMSEIVPAGNVTFGLDAVRHTMLLAKVSIQPSKLQVKG